MTDINLQSLNTLLVFKALYETGSATHAAKSLGITQSGVSRSLAQLERNIDMRLFMRYKNRLLKTPEADELYDEIKTLMTNLEDMKHTIVALREFGASRIRIASAPALGFTYLPKLIAKLLQHNPRYSIYFDILSSPDVITGVENGQFDLGFITLPFNSARLITHELFSVEAVCLVPIEHPLADQDHITLNNLKNQHLVIPNQPNLAADAILNLLSEKNIRIKGKTEANIASICGLIANGVGLSIINPITAYENQAINTGFVIKPFLPTIHYSFGLVHRRNWSDSQLLEFITQHLPSHPGITPLNPLV